MLFNGKDLYKKNSDLNETHVKNLIHQNLFKQKNFDKQIKYALKNKIKIKNYEK